MLSEIASLLYILGFIPCIEYWDEFTALFIGIDSLLCGMNPSIKYNFYISSSQYVELKRLFGLEKQQISVIKFY